MKCPKVVVCCCLACALGTASSACAATSQTAAAPPETSLPHATTAARTASQITRIKRAALGPHPSVRAVAPGAAHTKATTATASASTSARPATVLLKNGVLTVKANNSDLRQILQEIALAGGMTINGSVKSSRVYGIYGPRSPSDVLTDLLNGSGYNFMMVGVTPQGAPRELRITRQEGGPTPPQDLPPANPPASSLSPGGAAPRPPASGQQPLGPGVVEHVPPPPSQDPQVRMQQNLQRLQQMHDQQQQAPPR